MKTLLERFCEHAVSFDADLIKVEVKDRDDWVFANIGNVATKIARFKGSSSESKELRSNLYAARKKPIRRILGGQVYVLNVEIYENLGDDAFRVTILPAPKLDPATAARFTAKQGQYLAFIDSYMKIHRRSPAESDLQQYFQVTAPSIHQMIVSLQVRGFIERTPGEARSIRLLVPREQLPRLE